MKLYTDNIIESIPAGLVTLGSGDNIVSCNRNFEEIVGKPFSSLQDMNIHDALPGCPFRNSELCNDVIEFATECLNNDGKKIPVKISGSSLVDHDDQIIGSVLIIRDMSQLLEMEQQLERSRRMAALGKMAAGIAHEIRNPLGTLRGFAQFFGVKAGNDTESKGYADLMVSEVDRLNQNISGLLQFARPREPQKETVKVDALIAKAIALMEGDVSTNNVNLHCECNTHIELQADPDLLLQVLLNLLKNSISAIQESGGISLSVREEADQIIFSVTDTGRGMTEKERERMFDPFFTTKKTGTGLGLAVSHQIIEQHNGSFEVASSPEKGTEINIILPKC
jgi:two-component system sensor histidine kinase HydH